MELAAAFAAPPLPPAPPLLSRASSTAAVSDVAGVTATENTRAEAGTASNTSSDRRLERSAEQERQLLQHLTAEDFAAIQDQLGLRLRQSSEEDVGIPGDIQPEELTELAVIDDEAELAVRQTSPREENPYAAGAEEEQEPSLPVERPDFSAVVADAVVTIDEYLDWVNEAGGQPR